MWTGCRDISKWLHMNAVSNFIAHRSKATLVNAKVRTLLIFVTRESENTTNRIDTRLVRWPRRIDILCQYVFQETPLVDWAYRCLCRLGIRSCAKFRVPGFIRSSFLHCDLYCIIPTGFRIRKATGLHQGVSWVLINREKRKPGGIEMTWQHVAKWHFIEVIGRQLNMVWRVSTRESLLQCTSS